MSRRRDALSWFFIVFALLLVGAAALYAAWPHLQPQTTLRIGDGVFRTRVAKTEASRIQGLSGTQYLAKDAALLLAYNSEGKWTIWMKDMHYPIDIVWLDKDKKVVHIVKNAPPESYPDEKFVPQEDAMYVLELAAGTVAEKSISINDQAVFNESQLEEQL